MKNEAAPSHGPSLYRPRGVLGIFLVAALVLSGCGAAGGGPRPSSLPHSMKGYELYSWPAEGQAEWHHVLILGTNRLKTYEEILSADGAVTTSPWDRGTEELKSALGRLPEGENVFWISEAWLERAGVVAGTIRLPDPDLIAEIESYCRRLGIELQVAD